MPDGERIDIDAFVKYLLSIPGTEWYDLLERWISEGRLTEAEYVAIQKELRKQVELLSEQAEAQTWLREQEYAKWQEGLARTEEEKRFDKRAAAQAKREAEWRELHPKIAERLGYVPKYEEVAEEVYAGMAGPRPWRDWFESKYSEELRKYRRPEEEWREAQLTWAKRLQREKIMERKLKWMSEQEKKRAAELRGFYGMDWGPGLPFGIVTPELRELYETGWRPETSQPTGTLESGRLYGMGWRPGMPQPTGYLEAGQKAKELEKESLKRRLKFREMLKELSPMEKAELGWAEYLKRREPELREEYETRYPWGMYGRPWAYQPRIRTVGF